MPCPRAYGLMPPQRPRRRHPWRNAIVSAAVLLPVIGYVVHESLQAGEIECEVCIAFAGREACRAVAGKNEGDAMRGAVTNACALLASGVTDSLRCERTLPSKAVCR